MSRPRLKSLFAADFDIKRIIQDKILLGYENDFAKYAPIEIVPRTRLVWSRLISQLTKDNRKFVYGQVHKGSRAKDFEMAISWLVNTGLVLKVNCVEKPVLPINAYVNMDAFKLFCLDVGLLNAMAQISPKILLEKNLILTEFKGAFTEQFVAQQLKINHEIYYWVTSNSTAEVDFLIQKENEVIPIELKAEENLKSKSLRVFVEKYAVAMAIRTSMSRFRAQDWMTNVPFYGIYGI